MLFEFVRNRVFNARNYFADKKDPLKRNQFGGTIGGPIHKNTTFMFFGWQKTIIRSVNNASNAIIPTAANVTRRFLRRYEYPTTVHQKSVYARSICQQCQYRPGQHGGSQYDQAAARLLGVVERICHLRHAAPTEF